MDGDEDGKRAALPWWPNVAGAAGAAGKEPLSRDQIVAAAIRLIDADGIDGFSMRKLGQELDAGATSLYWHVKGKDQLIDLVLDEIVGEVKLDDDPSLPWRDRAAYVAWEFRRVVKRHRHLAPLAGSRLIMGPNLLTAIEHLFSILRAGGFDGVRLTLAFSAILTFALGTGITESREFTGPGSEGKTLEELEQLVVEMFQSLPADRFPNLVKQMAVADQSDIDNDAQFRYGLERLLDGLEMDLARASAGAEA
jgi:AcrR family transcriptional regulator